METHLHAQAEKKLGTLLRGKWRLERVLGVGGMGAVYEARHKNGKRVAVKILHAHLAAEPRVLKRFVREGYVANALQHPSVVSIDDNDIDEEGNAFLVMELLQGESLDERRQRAGGKLSQAEVLPLFAMLFDVLVVAGDRGIVHRDLKPENLFLHEDGSLRVVDFGLARAREVGLSVAGSLTNPDELLGTPAFMAPEQAIGRWDLVDARTDVWAASATLFTVLAGRPVHDGGSVPVLLVSAATKKAPPLASVAPEVHPLVAKLVDRGLTFSKAERPDARAVLADLVEAARALSVPLPDLPLRPAPSTPPPSTSVDDDDDPPLRSSLRRQVSSAPPSTLHTAKLRRSTGAEAYSPTLASTPPPDVRATSTATGLTAARGSSPSLQGSVPAVVVPVAIAATLIGAGVAALFLRPSPPAQPSSPGTPAVASTMAGAAPSAAGLTEAVPPASVVPSASAAPSATAAPAPSASAVTSHASPRKAGPTGSPDPSAQQKLLLERRK